MNLKRSIKLSIVFFIVFIAQISSAQNSNKINSSEFYSENFKTNTDRDLYVAGEKIYFKTYCSSNAKEIISKIAYAELISLNENISVYKGKFKIVGNIIKGNIQIPENINSGLYTLRIYTRWNRNTDKTSNFDKYVSVINPRIVSSSNFISNENSVKIVPSGNILLNNTKNDIIIFIPSDLREKNSFRILKNERVIKNIELEKGFFEFSETFSDSVKFSLLKISEKGDSSYYLFPPSNKNGFKINILKDNDLFKYNITDYNALKGKRLTLKAFSSAKKELYSSPVFMNGSVAENYIEKSILKTGLNYFVLFDANNEILNISCVFSKTDTIKKIAIDIPKNIFKTRELGNIELNYTGDKTVNADVSVILKGTDEFDNGFNPDYLFQNKNMTEEYLMTNNDLSNKEINQILTLYENFLNSRKNLIFSNSGLAKHDKFFIPDIRGVSLTGYVKDKKTLQALSNIKVTVSSFKSCPQIHFTYTDENGWFIISLNEFYDTNDLFVCTENPESQEILINNPFEEHLPENKNYTVFFNSGSNALLKNLYQNVQIHNSFSAKNKEFQKKNLFNIQAEFKNYNIDNYIQFRSLKELIYEIIPEVHLKLNNDGSYTFIIFDRNGSRLPGQPLVLYDNVPIYNIEKILNADYSVIKQFNVLNQPYILGKNIINGIISIHTNNNDLSSIDLSDSGYFLKYEGIQTANNENFLSVYSKTTPDFRNTLYWEPEILINKNKKRISFKTSDNTGTYKIIVKGYDSDNNFYYSTEYIQVIQ